MADRPTFSLTDDWVVLADLDHLTFRIYCILRTNAEFGRNGVVNHTVHVTASWVVDCTKHWEKPLAMSTVRKHMQKLVEAGVLDRVNDPSGGVGVIYQFVADPGEGYAHPVNGFEHAKRISRGRGTTSTYRRIPLDDGSLRVAQPEQKRKGRGTSELEDELEAVLHAHSEEEDLEFDTSGFDAPQPTDDGLTAKEREFAAELEEATGRNATPRLRLLAGQCERVAKAAGPALERGWEPAALARRLASELNQKINSPQQFLVKKLDEVGKPPSARRLSTLERPAVPEDRVTLDQVEDPEALERVERLKAQYQERMRARQMTGKGR